MDAAAPIVTSQRISRILSQTEATTEAIAAEPSFEASVTASDAFDKARFLAALNVAQGALQQAEKDAGVLAVTDNATASLLQSFLAEKSAQDSKLAAIPSGGLEATFDEHDWIGWAKQFFTWWKGIIPHRWLDPPETADGMGKKLRVAVLGDWGTGLYGAPVCAQSIARDPGRFQLLLHLGDVYYSGTDDEVRDRFLALWPTVDGAISRALNANHEMYTGGHAYFQQVLRRFNQPASCFATQNEHWTLIGLDSAYEDHDLVDKQLPWLRRIFAAAGERRIVLFSHHQPFSLLDQQGPKLVEKLAPLLNTRQVLAWYWGHEHRAVIYQPHPVWGLHGRCIGHSGYPYFSDFMKALKPAAEFKGWLSIPARDHLPSGMVLGGENPYVEGHAQRYGPNGYATLEFDGANLTEHVHAAEGGQVYSRRLT